MSIDDVDPQVPQLRAALVRAQRQLTVAKAKTEHLVEATISAAHDAVMASIDEQLTHWAAKLPKAESRTQRQQWMSVVDQWLDVRNRIALTTQLEQQLRQ